MSLHKVCIASGIFPPDKGGPAQFASSFSQWCVDQGYPTTVISLSDGPGTSNKVGDLQIQLISRRKNLLARYFATIRALMKISNDHTIIINGLFLETLFASLIKGFEYIAKVPGDIVWERARNQEKTLLDIDAYQGQEDFVKKIMRRLFTLSLKKAERVLAPSDHMASLIKSWGISGEKIVVVRNSVDLSLFKGESLLRPSYDLITVCRLTPWKGVSEIISESAKRDMSLCVIGSGPEEFALKKLALDLEAKVIFLGELDQKEIPAQIMKSRCFVLNSTYEGSPHALLEAMALGTLVIARESTGTSEVIVDGVNGLLCSQNRTLGESLNLIFNANFDGRRMKEKASQTIANQYSRERVFSSIIDYLKVLK